MRRSTLFSLCVLAALSIIIMSVTRVHADDLLNQVITPTPDTTIARTSAQVSGSVWVDSDCDGIKEENEPPLANAYIVQLVGAGEDGIFNTGDGAFGYWTDAIGNWISGRVSVDFFGKPYTYGVAIGAATARGWGYIPSPPGGDSILGPAPQYISAGFTLSDGEQKQVGPIGLCPTQTRVLLPRVMR